MTDNPHFPAPVPALWLLSKAIADLVAAEATDRTLARGAAAIRDEKRTMVRSLLQQLRSYVQVTADSDPEKGAAIIASAGMTNWVRATARYSTSGLPEGRLRDVRRALLAEQAKDALFAAERPVLTLPPITAVARGRRPEVLQARPATEPLPDISRMNCAPWRDLQMGSGRVQVCE